MSRFHLPLFVMFWAGATLALTRLRWVSRPSLIERLAPYEHGTEQVGSTALPAATIFELLGPIARSIGDRISAGVGVRESVSTRLDRMHSTVSPTQFRLRQLGLGGLALVVGVSVGVATGAPAVLAILLVVGLPLLVVLAVEQRLISADERRRKQLELELPVVAEQLGMLLSAGYSLGAAIGRIADRGQGVSGADLRRIATRIGHGTSTTEAMTEWATLSGVDAVSRLVSVLALNDHAGDLGRLVTNEARAVRRDIHRHRIETIERRSQQVWIPVTVAALVPGSIFIAVPFVEALRAFGAT